MSTLPYEIIFICFNTHLSGKKSSVSFLYNYHPNPQLTWKHLRDNVGAFSIAYKLRVPELWCQYTISPSDKHSVLAAIYNLLIDDFLEWCVAQEQKKTAFLPSIRVGGKLQHTLEQFFNTLLRSGQLEPVLEGSEYDSVHDIRSFNTDNSIHGQKSNGIFSPDDSINPLVSSFEQEPLYNNRNPNTSLFSSSPVRFSLHTCTSYRDGQTVSLGSGPLVTDTHYHASSLPVSLLPVTVTDGRLASEDTSVWHGTPALQQQLSSYNSIGGEQDTSATRVLLYKDIAATLSKTTDSADDILSTKSLPSTLSQYLETVAENQRQMKRDILSEVKRSKTQMTQNHTLKKQIKAAHRKANELCDTVSQAEKTMLTPSATHLLFSCVSDNEVFKVVKDVSQATQSLVCRTDAVPVSREDFSLLCHHKQSQTRVQSSKGNSALFPRHFHCSTMKPSAEMSKNSDNKNDDTVSDDTTDNETDKSVVDRFMSDISLGNEDNVLLDVSVGFTLPRHSVSATDNGLSVLGAKNSGEEAETHLCRDTQTHLRHALSLLQSHRNMKRTFSFFAGKNSDKIDGDTLCRDTRHMRHTSRLKMRRPHQSMAPFSSFPTEKDVSNTTTLKEVQENLCRDTSQAQVTRHTGDSTAATLRDTAHLYGAHSLPILYIDNKRRRLVCRDTEEDESLLFQLRHDLNSVSQSVASSDSALSVSPELLDLIVTQTKDKMQRLCVLADAQPTDSVNSADDTVKVQDTSKVSYKDTLSLIDESCQSSVAVCLGVVFEELATSICRQWRQSCGDKGQILSFINNVTCPQRSCVPEDNDNDEDTLMPSVRSQATHCLVTQSDSNLNLATNRATSLSFSKTLKSRNSGVSRCHSRFMQRYVSQQHPLFISSSNDTHNSSLKSNCNDRVYFETDKRFVRQFRIQDTLSSFSVLSPPAGLKLFPVGTHMYFQRDTKRKKTEKRIKKKTKTMKLKLPETQSYSQIHFSETPDTTSHLWNQVNEEEENEEVQQGGATQHRNKKKKPVSLLKQPHRAVVKRFLRTPVSCVSQASHMATLCHEDGLYDTRDTPRKVRNDKSKCVTVSQLREKYAKLHKSYISETLQKDTVVEGTKVATAEVQLEDSSLQLPNKSETFRRKRKFSK